MRIRKTAALVLGAAAFLLAWLAVRSAGGTLVLRMEDVDEQRSKKEFADAPHADMSLTFESFGYKHGIPTAADLVFDVRNLPNPYYDPQLRPLTGQDPAIVEFMKQQPMVAEMVGDITAFIEKWLPSYRATNRHYLTIAIGCTGGQHRSVYVAETLAKYFAQKMNSVAIRHRIIGQAKRPVRGSSQTL